MAIQVLNAILLLFAGFLAGNYFCGAPQALKFQPAVSINHAMPAQGILAAEHTSVLPGARGPASVSSALDMSTPTDAPVDLAAYLQKFGIADVHEACEFAHHRFLDQTVAAHARFVEGLDNFKEHKSYLNALGRRLAEGEKFWVARADLALEGGKANLEVIMDSHAFMPEADAEDNASCFRAHIRVNFANGHNFSTALDACTDSVVTKNRNYYLNWESFGDIEVGRQLSVVQIPLPESNGAELEFMRANGQIWAVGTGFLWEAVPLEQGLQLIDAISPELSSAMAQNRAASDP